MGGGKKQLKKFIKKLIKNTDQEALANLVSHLTNIQTDVVSEHITDNNNKIEEPIFKLLSVEISDMRFSETNEYHKQQRIKFDEQLVSCLTNGWKLYGGVHYENDYLLQILVKGITDKHILRN